MIKCGASGHNVRSRPSLKAPPVGMLVLGNRISVIDYIVNTDGCWVLLDQTTKENYCFNLDGEAWSLAMGHNNIMYLGNVKMPTCGTSNDKQNSTLPLPVELESSTKLMTVNKRGFDFSHKSSNQQSLNHHHNHQSAEQNNFTFGANQSVSPIILEQANSAATDSMSTNPFVFGENLRAESPKIPKRERKDGSKLSSLPKWFKGDDGKRC